MIARQPGPRRDRFVAAGGAIAATLLLGLLLLLGLRVALPNSEPIVSPRFVLFDPAPPPVVAPPPEPQIHPVSPVQAGGAAPQLSPPTATVVPIAPASPPIAVISGPDAGQSADDGDGTRDAATGSGTGSGSGSGSGQGSDGGQRARQIDGYISLADYPEAAKRAGAQGTVRVRYVVGVKGRVTNCSVTATSGSAALDEETCRLITRRYSFRPARDASGRAVPETHDDRFAWRLVD